MDKTFIFNLKYVYSDRSELDLAPSDFKISISIESYGEKTAGKYRKFFSSEKRIVSKLSKILIPNFNSTN